jgi:SNF2 family DNA or RNA helicase
VFNDVFLCFSMDLSWNFAAESQAYDRVHRLGQEKDVFVKRLVVENTIEERMLRLQEVKTGACINTHLLFFIQY